MILSTKITPVKLLGLNPDSSQQIADTDTSTGAIKLVYHSYIT